MAPVLIDFLEPLPNATIVSMELVDPFVGPFIVGRNLARAVNGRITFSSIALTAHPTPVGAYIDVMLTLTVPLIDDFTKRIITAIVSIIVLPCEPGEWLTSQMVCL